jgi:hypothetical protein
MTVDPSIVQYREMVERVCKVELDMELWLKVSLHIPNEVL